MGKVLQKNWVVFFWKNNIILFLSRSEHWIVHMCSSWQNCCVMFWVLCCYSDRKSELTWSPCSALGGSFSWTVFPFRVAVPERPETCMSPTHPARSLPNTSGLAKSWVQLCVAKSFWWVSGGDWSLLDSGIETQASVFFCLHYNKLLALSGQLWVEILITDKKKHIFQKHGCPETLLPHPLYVWPKAHFFWTQEVQKIIFPSFCVPVKYIWMRSQAQPLGGAGGALTPGGKLSRDGSRGLSGCLEIGALLPAPSLAVSTRPGRAKQSSPLT